MSTEHTLPEQCIKQTKEMSSKFIEETLWMRYFLFRQFNIGTEIDREDLEQTDIEWVCIALVYYPDFETMYAKHGLNKSELVYALYCSLMADKRRMNEATEKTREMIKTYCE